MVKFLFITHSEEIRECTVCLIRYLQLVVFMRAQPLPYADARPTHDLTAEHFITINSKSIIP